ncbi:MAG: response regulator [Planctomycetes bacterium]|nr:response regulator [Planctomycetota bacterium]
MNTLTEAEKKPVRILVVDDEQIIRDMLFDTLSQAGYTVKTAKDGNDAIAQIERESFDIVITDIKMPDISGMELLIRLQKENPNLCILLMTAYGNIKSAINAIKLGAYDYICKPFELSEMKNIVDKAAKRQRQL